MATVSAPLRAGSRSRVAAGGALLRTHGLLVGVTGIFAALVTIQLPGAITQDTWLSVLAGKTIWHSGLPAHDSLTFWTLGRTWIDQQWLAHLLSFGLYAAGGVVLLAMCHVVLVSSAVAGAAAFARRSGATARSIAWLALVATYPVLLAVENVRTQSFAAPLFVVLLALLVADARRPSPRVFGVLPVVALWANLHGSVVIAVLLVALRAAVGLVDPRLRVRSLCLGAGALAAAFATPYGFRTLTYYHEALLNPALRNFVSEWKPLQPSLATAPVFLLAAAAIWLMARRTPETATFELLAELLLVVLAFSAIRNIVWLGLGSFILLAAPLDAALGRREFWLPRANVIVGLTGLALAVLGATTVVARGSDGLTRGFPSAAGDVVARAADTKPGMRIYSSERFSDWLLLEHPSLRGRIAYDARFELLTSQQLQRITAWKNRTGGNWESAATGSAVLVIDMSDEAQTEAVLGRAPGLREPYRDGRIAVVVRR